MFANYQPVFFQVVDSKSFARTPESDFAGRSLREFPSAATDSSGRQLHILVKMACAPAPVNHVAYDAPMSLGNAAMYIDPLIPRGLPESPLYDIRIL